MRVVGAGFGRTGTLSVKRALDRLGLGPTYHMLEVFDQEGHADAWYQALRTGIDPDWDVLLAGYGSIVDWPGARWWRSLADHHPDAVVLLTRRDPAAWWSSISSTIFDSLRDPVPPGSPYEANRRMARAVVLEDTFGGDLSRDHVLAVLAAHEAEVRASVPAERLLVFDVAEGWGPLCERLEVAVPDEPFPRVNSTREFRLMAGLDH